jgi:hypothetical protein
MERDYFFCCKYSAKMRAAVSTIMAQGRFL